MAAQAVSNPNLQGQNIGTNTFQGGNGGGLSQPTFGALGKRKLQQAFSDNNPTGVSPSALMLPLARAGCTGFLHLRTYDKVDWNMYQPSG